MAGLPIRQSLPPYTGGISFGLRTAHSDPRIGFQPVQTLQGSPPNTLDWIGGITDWGVLGNDTIGDCVVACFGHVIEAWTQACNDPINISLQNAISAYSAMTGYNPQTGQPDPGLVLSDAMNFWTTTGIGGRKIDAFGTSNIAPFSPGSYPSVIKIATFYYGSAILGLNLPDAAINAFRNNGVWNGNMGNGNNGHCVPVLAYDDTYCDVITWGRVQRATWSFLQQYITEIWAASSGDWMLPNGASPSGNSRTILDHSVGGILNETLA